MKAEFNQQEDYVMMELMVSSRIESVGVWLKTSLARKAALGHEMESKCHIKQVAYWKPH